MIEGKLQSVIWKRYESRNLDLHQHTQSRKPGNSCATNALMLLTGKSKKQIEALSPRTDAMSTTRMQIILNHFGYSTKTITKGNLRSNFWSNNSINRYHCLLLNVCLGMDEDPMPEHSAFVIHRGYSWHNFQYEALDPYFLLSKPIQDCLIVHTPKWR